MTKPHSWFDRLTTNGMVFALLLAMVTGCGGSPPAATAETAIGDESPGTGLGTVSLTDRDIHFLPARGFGFGPIRLTPVATHTQHLLILGNLQSSTAQVTIKGSGSTGSAKTITSFNAGGIDDADTGDNLLHKLLRTAETDYAARQNPLPLPNKYQALQNCPTLQTFRVLASRMDSG